LEPDDFASGFVLRRPPDPNIYSLDYAAARLSENSYPDDAQFLGDAVQALDGRIKSVIDGDLDEAPPGVS
jgi:hypothetical protein